MRPLSQLVRNEWLLVMFTYSEHWGLRLEVPHPDPKGSNHFERGLMINSTIGSSKVPDHQARVSGGFKD